LGSRNEKRRHTAIDSTFCALSSRTVRAARLVERAQHVAAEIDAFLHLAGEARGTSGAGLSYMTSKIAVP
jgi:hypothetical protein